MVERLARLKIYDLYKDIGTQVSQRLPHAIKMPVMHFRRTAVTEAVKKFDTLLPGTWRREDEFKRKRKQ